VGVKTKLALAFSAVVLIMVIISFASSTLALVQEAKSAASDKVNSATQRLSADFVQIQNLNREMSSRLARNDNFLEAYSRQDRSAIAQEIKSASDQKGFAGFITVVDDNGHIFFSSETPAKFGAYVRDKSAGLDYVYKNVDSYNGPACFSPTGSITISSMVPLINKNGKFVGVVIASQPLNNEFLTGEVTKIAILPDPITNVDMAIFAGRSGSLIALTQTLANEHSPYVQRFLEDGAKALPFTDQNWFAKIFAGNSQATFDKSGRMWRQFNLLGSSNSQDIIGIILISAPIPGLGSKFLTNIYILLGSGAVAILLVFALSAIISTSWVRHLQLLTRQVSALTDSNKEIPQVAGLEGEWLTLSDKINEAFVSMRTTIQSLKGQMERLKDESVEKSGQPDTNSASQFEALNRQLANQSRQLSEVFKQVNYSNQQNVNLQHKLDAVLQSSTEGYLIMDQFGNVLSANPVLLQWLGMTEAEVAGRCCFDLVKKPGSPKESEVSTQAFSKHGGDPNALINEFYPEGIVYQKNSDKTTEVLAHLQPIGSEDSSVQGYVMVLRNKSLKKELSRLKSEITEVLSDSVRSPIANAESRWQSILYDPSIPPMVGQALAEVRAEYEKLLPAVDKLLTTYGSNSGVSAVMRETVSLSRIIADCLEQVSGLARERQLGLDYKGLAGLPSVFGKSDTITNSLTQFLEKMISVTGSGGRVRVESLIKGGEIRVSVLSSGPALSEADVADMFVGFIHDKHAEDTYSSRLSLYLARNNIERMGGKTWAETEAGRGTVIYFTLPVAS
jgi:PAS domain S-box-containing protein